MARDFADEDALPSGWRTQQPGSTVWAIISIPRFLLAALFYSIYYIPRSRRQHRKWTHRQALWTQLFKVAFRIMTELGYSQRLTFKPGKLGGRWVFTDPAEPNAYPRPFLSDKVKPEKIAGTWYPDALPTGQSTANRHDDGSLVVLSFHSGCFLWLTGRPEDSGFVAELLNRKLGSDTRSLWVQYRLPGGRNPTPYPGPMQDAITAYIYLVRTLGISPRRIVLAGDSSGSIIAVALLRCLAETDNEVLASLPPPKACLIFSPSVDYSFEGDSRAINENRNRRTDHCEAPMMAWGACAVAPPSQMRLDDPYLSPALYPFATPVPIFVQAGGAEILCDSIKGFADAMRAIPGNRIEYLEVPDVPHDIYAVGNFLGWGKEQEEVIDAAAAFVSRL
ncbi:hypothetical protein ANI_1_2168074 [Paecilomyces variotii No. 5]|uniref:Alpha/beta hydrolase fold-3 domain-containing protein n=1 Tax=Byssochlamys spectabilis (strain No. 5 / NBRC 109023) TaxID=1356009 RepID=V5GDE7_BYSSN|nr:hypothetical protein ANI_1_2168074 [Paecilomyces variotii No. 5]